MGSPAKTSIKELASILLLIAAIQAALVGVATRAYFTQHNTLLTNGDWIATKTTLERGLMGAFSFITERQPLAGEALNLGAWHGFQEVIHRRSIDPPRSLELDFYLDRHAYLAVLFNRDPERGYSGVRLSTPGRPRFPSTFFTATADGEFTDRQELSTRSLEPGQWHHARLDFSTNQVALSIDGQPTGTFTYTPRKRQTFGFRSGARHAYLDNIVVTLEDGETIVDAFGPPGATAGATAAMIAGVIAVSLVLFAALRRFSGVDDRRLGFPFLMVSLVLLVVAGTLYGFVRVRGDWYPGLGAALRQSETYFQKGAMEKVLGEIRERYPIEPEDDPFRILFIGSSQTWGAGAQRDDEAFVVVVESLLNRDARDGRRFECINAGISSTKAKDLHPLLAPEWLPLRPRVVVINLSSNDRSDRKWFGPHIRGMVTAIIEAGARPVLIKEANAPQYVERGLVARHRNLEQIAAELAVPLIDMQTYLNEHNVDGFLWWDKVHLTTFGQRLVAEKIVDELHDAGVLEDPR